MTAHQSSSSFIDAARQIAAKLAETATTRHKAGQAPFTELDLLWRSGLLKVLILAEDGGPGRRSIVAPPELSRTIPSGDDSIGQLTGYRHVGGLSQDLRFCVRRDQHFDAQ